ncbi:20056_t:CDS:2, partial [Gigaspora rosea]
HPREIEDQVKNLLPFELHLTDRRRVRAAAIALRQTGDKLPNTVEELKQQIEQRNLQTTLNFPITNQKEVLSAIDFLKQNLELEAIPDFAFQLTSLSLPSWELFEEAEIDIDTPMQENEPTQPTINTQKPDT